MWSEYRNGKWRYFERYKDALGRVRRVSVTLDRKADKKAYRTLENLISERSRAAGEYSIGEAVNLYIKDISCTLQPQTVIRNEHSLLKAAEMLGPYNRLDKLTAAYIRARYLDSGRPPRTCNENLRRLKTFIRWCYRHDLIPNTDCIDKLEPFADTPHRERIQDKYLNREELSALLDGVTDEGNRLITEFLALSGLRIGELIALNDEDVTDVIHVTKTFSAITHQMTPGKTFASRRDVHIQPELADCVKRIRQFMRLRKLAAGVPRCEFFVCSRKGNRINYEGYNKWIAENTERIIGRRLTAHALRHTHVSLLAERDYPLDAIARRLGHEGSEITKQIYLHITDGTIKKEADLLDKIDLLPPFCPHNSEESAGNVIK